MLFLLWHFCSATIVIIIYNVAVLSKRQKQIIDRLAKSKKVMTAQSLADQLQTSLRTIKRDIKAINEEYEDLLLSSRDGYSLNPDTDIEILSDAQIPEGYQERKKYIVKKLLLGERTTIDELCNKLYISPLTLQNELSLLRSELKELNINLHIKQNELTLSGSDKGKRKLLQEYLTEEMSHSSYYVEVVESFFPGADIRWLIGKVDQILHDYEYFLDNFALINYVIHLAIMIKMPYKHDRSELFSSQTKQLALFEECRDMMNQLCQEISDHYGRQFSPEELYDASFVMLTRIARIDYVPDEKGIELIDQDTRKLLKLICDNVRMNYDIELNKEPFYTLFSFHLKNLLIRTKNGTPIVNVQFKEIKTQFPMLYSVSVFIAKIIENYTGLSIDEDEIAFITLHIGTIIGYEQVMRKKLNCVVYAPNYYSLGNRISKSLQARFPDDLYISDIVTDGSIIQTDKTDLVFATSSLDRFPDVPSVTITPFLTQTDIMNCFTVIEETKIRKTKKNIMSKLDLFFKESCFLLNTGLKTREETIEKLGAIMLKGGYTDSNYTNSVFEREQISSTAFGNVAIPHPLNIDAKSSLIAVAIEKNGIQWGNGKVNIVFMLSIKREDHTYFREIFDFVALLTKDDDSLKKFLHINNYNDFISLLNNQ